MKGALLFVFALFAFSVLRPAAAGALECTLCELVAKTAETYVAKNATQQDIITFLDNACADLKVSGWVSDCKGIVSTYAPQIIEKLIAKETPDAICTELTLCSNLTFVKAQQETGGLECTLCTLVVKAAETFVAKNSSEQYVVTELDKVCGDLKISSWVTACKGLVNTYAPQIIQKLIDKETPDQICQELTLCSNLTDIPKKAVAPSKPQLPQKEQGGLECTLCTVVTKAAEGFVAKNSSEQYVVTELDKVCGDLKISSWVTACKGLVNTYAPQIIQKLIAKETPAQICSDLGLCSNLTLVATLPQKEQGELECGVCTFLVGSVEKYVAENKTETEILTSLEGDCSVLKSKSWIATCQGAIGTYGPQIIQLVMQKEPADVVCSQVGLCKNSTKVAVSSIVPVKVVGSANVAAPTNLSCIFCEFLVNTTEGFVAQNKTESEIVDELNKACNDIPIKSWAAACSSMIEEYGDLIIAYVVNEEPASVACVELKLCAPSHKFSAYNINRLFQ